MSAVPDPQERGTGCQRGQPGAKENGCPLTPSMLVLLLALVRADVVTVEIPEALIDGDIQANAAAYCRQHGLGPTPRGVACADAVLVDAGGDPVDPEREPDLANFGGEPEFAYVLLRGYKRAISPNLPKNCRFVPTCSEYTALAIKEFGFAKGFVLFIWRLMRCNPAGGKGYDSPAWPPVGFKAGDALPAPRGRMPSLVEEDVD